MLEGRDTLAVLPTGSGKSAIYQIPALLLDGPTVVVSPLIALQRDQVANLVGVTGAGSAMSANSTIGAGERRSALEGIQTGDVEFLFLAPEQLKKDDVVDRAARRRVRACSSSTRPTASAGGGTTSAPTTSSSAA